MSDTIETYIAEELEPHHYGIALLIQRMYGETYARRHNGRKEEWIEYCDGTWRTRPGIYHDLKNKLSSEVRPLIRKVLSTLRDACHQTQDYYTLGSDKLERLSRIIEMLSDTNVKDTILKECQSVMFVTIEENDDESEESDE